MVAPARMKIDHVRARRWALGLAGALFMAGAVAATIPGVGPPLVMLRLWGDWAMFAGPAASSIPVVVGKPRDGGPELVVVNPVDHARPYLERLHGARDEKLHEQLGRPTAPQAIRQSYLDHVCAEQQGRFASLALRPWTRSGTLGPPIAERQCK
jgi:hypothetical protein